MTHAIIALGSNLGDRADTIHSAVAALADAEGVEVTGISTVIETVALTLDDSDAPAYLNGVVRIDTTLDAHELLATLQAIELAHGRERIARWGDRTLDLDIIVFGDTVISTETLTIPHPEAHRRTFVLEPWVELEPDAELPGLGRIQTLLDTARTQGT